MFLNRFLPQTYLRPSLNQQIKAIQTPERESALLCSKLMCNVKGEGGVRAYCYPLNRLDLLQFVLAWAIRQTERTSIVQQTRWVNGSSFLKKKREKVGRIPCYATISLQGGQNLDISLLLHTKAVLSVLYLPERGADGL